MLREVRSGRGKEDPKAYRLVIIFPPLRVDAGRPCVLAVQLKQLSGLIVLFFSKATFERRHTHP